MEFLRFNILRCRFSSPFRTGLGLVLLLALLLPASTAAAVAPKNVFILQSYHAGLRWSDDILAGIQEIFDQSGEGLQLHVEYLDTKRYNTPEYVSTLLETVIPYKLSGHEFDLAILVDNDAFDFGRRHRNDLFAGTPLVFCAVNGYTPAMIAGLEAITGVAEELPVQETVSMALQLHPKTEEIIVIGNGQDRTAGLIHDQFRQVVPATAPQVRLTFWDDLSAEDLPERLKGLPANRILFISSILRNRNGQAMSYIQSSRWVHEHSTVPIYGFWDFFLGEGIVGGKLLSARNQGRIAARLALRILRGENAERFPVVTETDHRYAFDYRELQRFSIPLSALPPNSRIINSPPTFYSIDKNYLWAALITFGAVLALAFTLALLLLQRKRATREIQSLARFASENTNPVLRVNRAGLLLYANNAAIKFPACLGAEIGEPVLEKMQTTIEEALRAGQPKRFECSCEGRIFDFSCVPVPEEGYANLYGQDVTERRRSEAALQESEGRFRALIEQAADAFLLHDLEGQILDVNPQACQDLGYSRDELIRLNVSDIETGTTLDQAKAIWRQLEPGSRVSVDGVYRRKDGTTFPVEIGLGLIDRLGQRLISALVRNVTERKEAEDAIRAALTEAEDARDRIDAILKSVADGLMVTDLSLRISMLNRAAENLFGFTLAEAINRPIETMVQEPPLAAQIERLVTENLDSAHTEWDIPGTDGTALRTIEARTAIARRPGGARMGTITILRDITSEREIDRMKNEFISTAAHELRTPLTSVMGYTELILHQEEFGRISAEQQKEYLGIIYEKSKVLTKIIEDLLDLSRVQAGKLISLEQTPEDIGQLLTEILTPYRTMAKRHQFLIHLPEKPQHFLFDRGKIGQVLENLLSNAVKFSPAGGTIRVSGEVVGPDFQLTVEDEGIGMTKQQQDKIFEKFYRVDASTTAIGGLGLGMAIVSNIIEAHGGQILVESQPGVGTKVTFSLPMVTEKP